MPFDSDITLYGYSSQTETPGFKAWQEATGVTIELVEPTDETALNLLIASGDLPDIIRASKEFYNGGMTAMIDDGIAIDLTDLLPEYAPAYNAYITSDEAIYNSAAVEVNDELCVLAFAGQFYPVDSPFRSYAGIIVRKDFMDELGIESIETVDDFKTYLSRCKEELGVSVPFMSQNTMNDYNWKYGLLTSAFGLPCAYDYQVDGVYHFGAYEPEFKDFLAYMNELYAEGLLDPNFTVTDNATAIASITSGDSAAICAMVSRFQVIETAAEDPELALTAIPSLTANAGETAMMSYASNITSTGSWCFITEECEDVESAMRWMDYLYTEEGMDLANYGIEGTTYTVDENGEVQLTEFVTDNPDGYAIDPILRSYGLVNWSCVHRREFSEKRFPLAEQRDGCAIWADSQYNDYMLSNYSVPTELQEEYTQLRTDIDTYLSEMIANFIAGTEPLDNFDSYLENLRTLGVERFIEIMQLAIDPYYNT